MADEQSDSSGGAPPKSGWAPMVPELLVEDFSRSLAFWRDVCGFRVAYARPEQHFAYLERPEGAQVMLCQRAGNWETGPLERPFGRGVMFQLYVGDLAAIETRLAATATPLHHGPREVWRRTGDRMSGQREVFVLDPDGYLIMLAQRIGERPLAD